MTSYAMGVVGGRVHIEASDPLCLHLSDHPGQSLVVDIFSGDDFENWRHSMTIALLAKQNLPFIDGSYFKPDPNSPLLPY